jgi:hypothetical protein
MNNLFHTLKPFATVANQISHEDAQIIPRILAAETIFEYWPEFVHRPQVDISFEIICAIESIRKLFHRGAIYKAQCLLSSVIACNINSLSSKVPVAIANYTVFLIFVDMVDEAIRRRDISHMNRQVLVFVQRSYEQRLHDALFDSAITFD